MFMRFRLALITMLACLGVVGIVYGADISEKKVSTYINFITNPSGTPTATVKISPAGQLQVPTIANFAGTGSPNFPFGLTSSGNANVDFDSTNHTLFVDGTSNFVGIVNNAPGEPLDVTGNIKSSGTVKVDTITNAAGSGKPNFSQGLKSAGDVVVGNGDATGTTTAGTLRGPARTGSNVAGVDTTVDAANGTGTGGSGNLLFRTAPVAGSSSSANTLAEVLRLGKTGVMTSTSQANVDNTFSVDTTTATSDSAIQFAQGGTARWIMGNDDSASDAFVLSNGGSLGTSNFFSSTSGGALTLGASASTQTQTINARDIYIPSSAANTNALNTSPSTSVPVVGHKESNIELGAATNSLVLHNNVYNDAGTKKYGHTDSRTSAEFVVSSSAATSGTAFDFQTSSSVAAHNVGDADTLTSKGKITPAGAWTIGEAAGTQAHSMLGTLNITSGSSQLLSIGTSASTLGNSADSSGDLTLERSGSGTQGGVLRFDRAGTQRAVMVISGGTGQVVAGDAPNDLDIKVDTTDLNLATATAGVVQKITQAGNVTIGVSGNALTQTINARDIYIPSSAASTNALNTAPSTNVPVIGHKESNVELGASTNGLVLHNNVYNDAGTKKYGHTDSRTSAEFTVASSGTTSGTAFDFQTSSSIAAHSVGDADTLTSKGKITPAGAWTIGEAASAQTQTINSRDIFINNTANDAVAIGASPSSQQTNVGNKSTNIYFGSSNSVLAMMAGLYNDGSYRYSNSSSQTGSLFYIQPAASQGSAAFEWYTDATLSHTGGNAASGLTLTGQITGLGVVSWPQNIAVSAYYNGANQGPYNTATTNLIAYNTEESDTRGTFASNAFVPGVTGKYQISCGAQIEPSSGAEKFKRVTLSLYKNASEYKRLSTYQNTGAANGVFQGQQVISGSIMALSNTTDSFDCRMYAETVGSGTWLVEGGDTFSTWFTAVKMM